MKRLSNLAAAPFAALLCLALLTGCAQSRAEVAGVYELDKERIAAAMRTAFEADEEMKNNPLADVMMNAMLEAMSMTLTLEADGSATVVTKGMGPESPPATGTWSLSGTTVTISAAEPGKEPDPISGTVEGDTITLHTPPDEEMPFELVFTRQEA